MASAAAMTGQEAARYTRTAIALHWTIAALIVINLLLGLFHEGWSRPTIAWIMFFHRAIGFTILGLTLVRLAWRLTHRPPGFDPSLKPWEAMLAKLIHVLFYVALIAIPLSGWAITAEGGRPTSFFGLFNIGPPPFVSRSEDAHELFEEIHALLAYATIGLLLLHVAGALKHHFEGHRHMIGRMAPWAYRGPQPPTP
jgi:cytochrome b561